MRNEAVVLRYTTHIHVVGSVKSYSVLTCELSASTEYVHTTLQEFRSDATSNIQHVVSEHENGLIRRIDIDKDAIKAVHLFEYTYYTMPGEVFLPLSYRELICIIPFYKITLY